MRPDVRAVLFDLDGTLIDSAPDLAAATNDLLLSRGLATMPYDHLRVHAGAGARGMLGAAFHAKPGDAGYDALRDAFYDRYEVRMLESTHFFEFVPQVLTALDDAGIPWGIVTNKAMRFALPSAQALGLASRATALIAGDSTPFTKPHPAPLLAATGRLGMSPDRCVYVGDDPRDIQAGKAAGMRTLAAAWGYLGPDLEIHEWGADQVLNQPHQLLQWLELP